MPQEIVRTVWTFPRGGRTRRPRTTLRSALARGLGALAAFAGFVVALAVSPVVARAQIAVTPVGAPRWRVDLTLFAAPAGPPFALAESTVAAIAPNDFPIHVPHAPPYDREHADGVARAGFARGPRFDALQFTAPSAIWLSILWTPGPAAPVGSSPDFESGPVIPGTLYPFQLAGDVFRNGALFESEEVPPETFLAPVGVTGASHDARCLFESSLYARPGLTDLTGAYEYRLTLRDAGGQGYDLSARFVVVPNVVPEPGTCALIAGGLAGVGALARRRRCAHGLTQQPYGAPDGAGNIAARPDTYRGRLMRLVPSALVDEVDSSRPATRR